MQNLEKGSVVRDLVWLFRNSITKLANHSYGKQRVDRMGNNDVPDPDAFSREGDANWVVVYKLGYSVKFLHRVLAEQHACENSGDVLALFCPAYHFAQLEDCASQSLLRGFLHGFSEFI